MTFDAAVIWLEMAEHAPTEPGASEGLLGALGTFNRLRVVPWIARARAALAIPQP